MSSSSKLPPPSTSISSSSSSTAGSRALQETLHVLLSRISATMAHVQTWPSEQQAQSQSNKTTAADTNTNVHVASTTQLIQHLNQVVTALQRVEGTLKSDAALRRSLQECPVPVDLLDLLDSSKLNPDVFARGLLREALGQLAGLRRRKLALEMLGAAIQSGIQRRKNQKNKNKRTREEVVIMEEKVEADSIASKVGVAPKSVPGTAAADDKAGSSTEPPPPPAKRQRTEE